jgi:hypothetical protein
MAFSEIQIDRLGDYTSFFPGPQSTLLIQSILAGNTIARLWIGGGLGHPDIAILWDFGNKGLYFGGVAASSQSRSALPGFVHGQLATVARSAGLPYCSIRALLPDSVAPLLDAFGDSITSSRRKLFHERAPDTRTVAIKHSSDMQLVSIDQDLLSSGLANSDRIAVEIKWMWPSVDQFLTHGWGVAGVADGRVVCWCTAEYVGPSQCGIGIETIGGQQNKGIATATGARFIEECMRRGRKPCWECDLNNTPSLHVASKLGFSLTESTNWYIGRW